MSLIKKVREIVFKKIGRPLDKVISIDTVKLKINAIDIGGIDYDSRSSFEVLHDKSWSLLNAWLRPDLVIDIGANYGFISVILRKYFPQSELISIEPNPNLIPYIKFNFAHNNVENFLMLNSLVGGHTGISDFNLNTKDSQDSRVAKASDFESTIIKTPSITFEDLVKKSKLKDPVFFAKIDTQGHEPTILRASLDFLSTRSKKWVLKIEYAPFWLKSQGHDPLEFLQFLVSNFDVFEASHRTAFLIDSFNELVSEKRRLKPEVLVNFICHITSLNRDSMGWCDLIIIPKK
jgi:FkbM family methyltransferase